MSFLVFYALDPGLPPMQAPRLPLFSRLPYAGEGCNFSPKRLPPHLIAQHARLVLDAEEALAQGDPKHMIFQAARAPATDPLRREWPGVLGRIIEGVDDPPRLTPLEPDLLPG